MAHEHTHITDLTAPAVRRLALSLGITLVFVFVEVAAGFLANSLALLTDAAHNLTDVVALALTWWALRVTTRPASAGKTYGYHRAGILVALANSTTLVLITIGIFYEAYKRLVSPPAVKADILIGIGLAAVVVNLVTALLVRRGSDKDLNLRSAFLHLIGDVISTVGAVLAGVLIRFTGWDWLDPLVSVLIGGLILWNAWGIVRESISILMEATPADIDMESLLDDVRSVMGVRGVHDLHVWSITRDLRVLSAHVVAESASLRESADMLRSLNVLLAERYHIHHATWQLEDQDCEGCPL